MYCEDDEISALIYNELSKVNITLAELFNYISKNVRYFHFLYNLCLDYMFIYLYC